MMRRFLPSIIMHSEPLGEVIVADNASTDDSLDMLAREFPTVRTIRLDRNYGFAEGYNRAIAQVDTPYVMLLNSDVETTPGYLEPLYEYMQTHPDVAAVQPKLLAETRRTHFEYAGAAGGYIDALGYPYCRGRIFDTVEPDRGQYDTVTDVDWATGAAMLTRARIYKEVGGLDARFFAHMEEIDLCWRMRRAGWRLACVPQSTVYHVGGGTLPQGNPRKTYLNFRNSLLMLHKNHPQARRTLRIRWWLDALASLVFLLKGNTADCRAVWSAHRDADLAIRDCTTAMNTNTTPMNSCTTPMNSCTTPLYNVSVAPLRSILWAYHIRRQRTFADLCHASAPTPPCGDAGHQ